MLDKFARYPLTFGPTPIEKLERLSKHLGGNVEIYAKREDCNSGLAYGGNKLRKLEYIIPDAIASNADTLVSIGGVQSNHTRMIAAVAAKIGMKCRLVQEAWVPHEDAVYDRVGNIMLSRIMGADVRLVDDGFDIGIRKSWERAASLTRSPPAPPCTSLVASAMSASPRKCASRKPSSASSSITSWSAPSPARPMPACWSASPPTAARER
jgi:1-aminocyclopropane-1-carboxylate deaminase